MIKYKKEILVGGLVALSIILAAIFVSLMGSFSPFGSSGKFFVEYNFAGGIEVGSPVRVSGVKVGRVDSIEFTSNLEAPLKLTLSVDKRALSSVRKDSKFYVNLAGIIGERYIEITPGSGEILPPRSTTRGIDPPRIDQLLSQGYGFFGKLQEFFEQNEESLSEFMGYFNQLLKEANTLLKTKENRQRFFSLVNHLSLLAEDLHGMAIKLKSKEGEEFFDNLITILKRAEKLDEKALREFLQKEGVRVKVF